VRRGDGERRGAGQSHDDAKKNRLPRAVGGGLVREGEKGPQEARPGEERTEDPPLIPSRHRIGVSPSALAGVGKRSARHGEQKRRERCEAEALGKTL